MKKIIFSIILLLWSSLGISQNNLINYDTSLCSKYGHIKYIFIGEDTARVIMVKSNIICSDNIIYDNTVDTLTCDRCNKKILFWKDSEEVYLYIQKNLKKNISY